MGKGLFGKKRKTDDLENELEQAKKEAEAAKKALKDVMDQSVQTKQVKSEALKEAKEAEEKAAEAEEKIAELQEEIKDMKEEKSREQMAEARQKAVEERRAKLESMKKEEVKTIHTVKEGETLSHIALKYYNHATPPYWKFLLEHNTEILKGNERNVRVGMELEIPELPEELKD